MDLIVFFGYFSIVHLLLFIIVLIVIEQFKLVNVSVSLILVTILNQVWLNLMVYEKCIQSYPFFFYINSFLIFICPFLFLNIIKSLTGFVLFQFKKMDLLYLIPFVFLFSAYQWLLIKPVMFQQDSFGNMGKSKPSLQILILSLLWIWQMMLYVIFLSKQISMDKTLNPKGKISNAVKKRIIILIVLFLLISIPPISYPIDPSSTLVYIFVNILLLQFFLISWSNKCFINNYPPSQDSKELKSQPTSLSSTSAELLVKKFMSLSEKLMEQDKIYTNSNITVEKFARLCNTPKYLVTQLINQCYGSTFREYINKYRVSEAIRLMRIPEYRKYNIEVIAQMSGFNSRSAFYSVFKQQTGITPVQYVKALDEDKCQ
jgi:AraC-like DNA-binding protein